MGEVKGYQPSEEEIRKAEGSMDEGQKRLSKIREGLVSLGVDKELYDQIKGLRLDLRGIKELEDDHGTFLTNPTSGKISGRLEDREIELEWFNSDAHTSKSENHYFGSVGDKKLSSDEAKALFIKFRNLIENIETLEYSEERYHKEEGQKRLRAANSNTDEDVIKRFLG